MGSSAAFKIHIEDEDFFVEPLNAKMVAELNNWVKGRMLETAKLAIQGETDPDLRKEMLQAALAEASQMTFMTERGMKLFGTIEGICQLFYVTCKGQSPQLTYDRSMELLLSPGAAEAFDIAFKEVTNSRPRPTQPQRGRQQRKKQQRKR